MVNVEVTDTEVQVLDLRGIPFDLFGVLRIPRPYFKANGQLSGIPGGESRLRSQYHKLSVRNHPENWPAGPAFFCDECGVEIHSGGGWWHKVGRDLCSSCHNVVTEQLLANGCTSMGYVEVINLDVLGDHRYQYEAALNTIKRRKKAELKFAQIGVAYSVLKDINLRSIYCRNSAGIDSKENKYENGFKMLVKAETYAANSCFDICPYEQYDAFFSGVDPADREYLLLNGNSHLTDDESDGTDEEVIDKDESLEEENIMNIVQIDMNKENITKEESKKEKMKSLEQLPKPPLLLAVQLGMPISSISTKQRSDIFQQISTEFSMVNSTNTSSSSESLSSPKICEEKNKVEPSIKFSKTKPSAKTKLQISKCFSSNSNLFPGIPQRPMGL